MIVTFLLPSTTRAIGGLIALYEFANGLSRRGHRVHLVHLPFGAGHIEHLDDLAWFPFDARVEHHLLESFDPARLPDADFVEVTALEFFTGTEHRDDIARTLPPAVGLPFVFIQAYGIYTPDVDHHAFRAPFPKLCIAHWLVKVVRDSGAPPQQVAYIAQGLDHETFRLTRPIADRPVQVAMLYNAHPIKGAAIGLAALEQVRSRIPELRVTVFGNKNYAADLPPWVTFAMLPPRSVLVDEIYNRSRVFVCASPREGFGLSSIEAMASGCALVTAANGGSADYAIDGETALVCEPHDVAGLADRIERLLRDDELRTRIATRGMEFVRRFDWNESARQLESFLERYGAERSGAAP
jgi:glycosyltransferase involved in cell wall biosynthesis